MKKIRFCKKLNFWDKKWTFKIVWDLVPLSEIQLKCTLVQLKKCRENEVSNFDSSILPLLEN